MVMEDEVDRHAMAAADKSRIRGIINMSTVVPDPPQARGVKAAPETGKGRLRLNVGIVVEKAIEKMSAAKRRPIRTNLDRVELNKEIGSGGTTHKA